MGRGFGNVDIWGKGGLFEQRLEQKMRLDEEELDIDQQNANSLSAFREDSTEIGAFGENTDRLAVDPEHELTSGLRGLGRGGRTTLFDNDGNTIGFRGSKVGIPSSSSRRPNRLSSGAIERGNTSLRAKGLSEGAFDEPTLFAKGGKVGMRAYAKGGKVSAAMVKKHGKMCMPGYAQGGAIQLPEEPGPMGDVAQDTGEDTQEVVVREGEYLLNPETVEFMGGGDYEEGVRNLNQLVEQATGEEPGPEMVGDKQGFADGGLNDITAAREAERARAAEEAINKLREERRMARPKPRPEVKPLPKATTPKPSGFRAAISGKNTTTLGDVGRGVRTVAQKTHPLTNLAKASRASLGGLGIEAAVEGFNTDTADYATRIGVDNPESFGGMLGVRAAGLMTDLGAGIGNLAALPGNILEHGVNSPSEFLDKGLGGGRGYFDVRDRFADVQNANAAATAEGQVPVAEPSVGPVALDPAAEGVQPLPPAVDPNQYFRPFGNEQVGLRGMNIVQNTGGPGNEVIVQEVGPNGEPSFSNLRDTPFGTNLQGEADARVAEDEVRRQAAARNNLLPAAASTPETAAQVLAAEARAKGVSPKKIGDTDKRIDRRFRQPTFNADGKATGFIDDPEMQTAFRDAMGQLGIDMYAESEARQDELFDAFEPVYNDVIQSMTAAKAQDLPVSDVPRTANSPNALRRLEGSNIGLGDVLGPEATLSDYGAGFFNNDPVNNEFVVDPVSGARIPARRAVRDPRHGGRSLEALRNYGYLEGQ